ncbi:hypothetical protein BGZ57DRAFT_860746 [Hyaloscypha finlandica]|nr:hypothetical protein BGZ57DRAFT_860746 [Hyaloscypha finlandica]
MTSYKRVFLSCWVSLDERDRLCEVSLDSLLSKKFLGHPTSRSRRTTDLSLVRHHRVEIRREGDVPSDPIIILEDTPSITVAADTNTPPRSPHQRPRPESYTGVMARSSSRTKKISSLRRRGGSRQNSSQEKIDSLNLSDDPGHSTSTSTQPSNDMALGCHLPVESSASTTEENPQRVSSAPEPLPTDEKADPAISTDELVTTSGAATGSASSIILSSSPEADTRPEDLGQTCPPVACTHPVAKIAACSKDAKCACKNSSLLEIVWQQNWLLDRGM